MELANDYAEALNREAKRHIERLRDYGGFLAQAGISLNEVDLKGEDAAYVQQGFFRQLRDYPNG